MGNVKRILLGASCTVAVMAMGTGSAFAGEITGTGGSTAAPQHGKSWCLFSGLDDPDDDGFGRTQNWGQIPKSGRDALPAFMHPGMACNPQRTLFGDPRGGH